MAKTQSKLFQAVPFEFGDRLLLDHPGPIISDPLHLLPVNAAGDAAPSTTRANGGQ